MFPASACNSRAIPTSSNNVHNSIDDMRKKHNQHIKTEDQENTVSLLRQVYSEHFSAPQAKRMFTVSPCNLGDLPSNNDQTIVGDISRKKQPRIETEEGEDDQDNTVLERGKKVRTSNSEDVADASSSDDSWFVGLVTEANLQEDTLSLPKDHTSSSGLSRNCRKIVLTDGGDRSWVMDLGFNLFTDTFYITRGWRHFCDENGKKAVGSSFKFKLVTNEETPLLRFCPSESTINYTSSANNQRFVTPYLSYDSFNKNRLYFAKQFLRQNGLEEPRMVTLAGKDGTRMFSNLLRETSGRMLLGKGWREFANANNLKIGEAFTLECIWENETPVLILSDTKLKSGMRPYRGKLSEASEKGSVSIAARNGKEPAEEYVSTEAANNGNEPENGVNIPQEINSSSLIENRVMLTLLPEHVKAGMLCLPTEFMRANGIDDVLGTIIMLGIDDMQWWWGHLLSKSGVVAVGCDWKHFCRANGLEIGMTFTLEFLYKMDKTLEPVLQLYPSSKT